MPRERSQQHNAVPFLPGRMVVVKVLHLNRTELINLRQVLRIVGQHPPILNIDHGLG